MNVDSKVDLKVDLKVNSKVDNNNDDDDGLGCFNKGSLPTSESRDML